MVAKLGAAQQKGACKTDQDAVFIKLELDKADVCESKAEGYYRDGLDRNRSAGKRLLKKREECRQKEHPYYKNWLGWLEDNGIKQQRASDCIRLHKGWEKLPPGGSFSLKEALRIIEAGKPEQNRRSRQVPTGDDSRAITFPKDLADKLDPLCAALMEKLQISTEAATYARAMEEAYERHVAGKGVARG